ncbi:MAG TPA: hypothetical protein VD790_07695 [Thermoleophilaceae bacterium]|nr:hypothetical protein [Thermoleophilaceae bacterium]
MDGQLLTRRRLLAAGGAGVLGLTGMTAVAEALADAGAAMAATVQRSPVPTDEAVRATVAALADTIVPGPAGGGDHDPGAVEAGVIDVLYDPFYGLATVFPVIHTDVQSATPVILGRLAAFDLALPYADRERVLDDRMPGWPDGGSNPTALAYSLFGVLTYLAYYGQSAGDVGLKVIGLPPHSDGYWPHHTYELSFEGMTADGNPR